MSGLGAEGLDELPCRGQVGDAGPGQEFDAHLCADIGGRGDQNGQVVASVAEVGQGGPEGDGGDLRSADRFRRLGNLLGLGCRIGRSGVGPGRCRFDHLDVEIEAGEGGDVERPYRGLAHTRGDQRLASTAYIGFGRAQWIEPSAWPYRYPTSDRQR